MATRSSCCVLVLVSVLTWVAYASAEGTLTSSAGVLTGSVNLVDQTWVCRQPVDLTSVTVTISPTSAQKDAVHLGSGCTGSIGAIDVVLEAVGDGIKIGEGAHDLAIGGGTIQCLTRKGLVHQDGVQAMGGQRITFTGLDVACLSSNNSDFFVNQGTSSRQTPTSIVCISCRFGASPTDPSTGHATQGPSSTVFISHSVGSGVESSLICPGHNFQLRIGPDAVNPVNRGNTLATAC
jgi:hypothetical protein